MIFYLSDGKESPKFYFYGGGLRPFFSSMQEYAKLSRYFIFNDTL